MEVKNTKTILTIVTDYVGDVLTLANEEDKKDPAKIQAVAELLDAYTKAYIHLL